MYRTPGQSTRLAAPTVPRRRLALHRRSALFSSDSTHHPQKKQPSHERSRTTTTSSIRSFECGYTSRSRLPQSASSRGSQANTTGKTRAVVALATIDPPLAARVVACSGDSCRRRQAGQYGNTRGYRDVFAGHGTPTFSAFGLKLCRLRAVADIRQGALIPDWNVALLTIARRLPAGAMRDLSCEGTH
jgi:hypothetical protein